MHQILICIRSRNLKLQKTETLFLNYKVIFNELEKRKSTRYGSRKIMGKTNKNNNLMMKLLSNSSPIFFKKFRYQAIINKNQQYQQVQVRYKIYSSCSDWVNLCCLTKYYNQIQNFEIILHFQSRTKSYPIINQLSSLTSTPKEYTYMAPTIRWTQQEDDYMRELRKQHGVKSWTTISQYISKKFPDKECSGKQCRQRYVNHAQFLSENSQQRWTPEDHKQIFQQVKELGCKWRIISNEFQGRSENAIKNRFYGSLRKFIRIINSTGKKHIKKYTKPIKYESIVRIMEAAESAWKIYPNIKDISEDLKNQILTLAATQIQLIPDEAVLELIDRIHQFNLITRSYNLRKNRNTSGGSETELKMCQKSVKQNPSSLKTNCSELMLAKKQNTCQQSIMNKKIVKVSQLNKNNFEYQLSMDLENIQEDYKSSYGSSNLDRQLCEIMGQRFIPQPDNLAQLL